MDGRRRSIFAFCHADSLLLQGLHHLSGHFFKRFLSAEQWMDDRVATMNECGDITGIEGFLKFGHACH